MLSSFARWILTATAVAPVLLSFAAVFAFDKEWHWAIAAVGGCLLLVAVCYGMIRHARRELASSNFGFVKLEAADRENISFLLIYLLPLFTADLDNLNWSIWLPAIAIFAWITATGYSYHFNPLLNVLGWHFYRVEATEGVTYVLLTKRELRTASTSVEVCQLTEYILLDKG